MTWFSFISKQQFLCTSIRHIHVAVFQSMPRRGSFQSSLASNLPKSDAVKSNKRCRQCKYYSSFTSNSRDVQVQPPVTQRLCNITGKLIVQFAFKFTKSLHLRRKMILLIERNGWLWWWIWKIVCKQFQSLQSWINIQGIYWEDIYNTLAVKCLRLNLNFKP